MRVSAVAFLIMVACVDERAAFVTFGDKLAFNGFGDDPRSLKCVFRNALQPQMRMRQPALKVRAAKAQTHSIALTTIARPVAQLHFPPKPPRATKEPATLGRCGLAPPYPNLVGSFRQPSALRHGALFRRCKGFYRGEASEKCKPGE